MAFSVQLIEMVAVLYYSFFDEIFTCGRMGFSTGGAMDLKISFIDDIDLSHYIATTPSTEQ